MFRNLPRRIIFLVFLYSFIIFGIILLQFKNSTGFSQSVAFMRLTGFTKTDEQGRQVPDLPLHISVNGIVFFIDAQNPLKVYTKDNKELIPNIENISSDENSIELVFSEDIAVSFRSERRGDIDEAIISASFSNKIDRLYLPFKTTKQSRLDLKDGQTWVSFDQKQFKFDNELVDSDRNTKQLALIFDKENQTVGYKTWLKPEGLNLEKLEVISSFNNSDFQDALEKYAAKALTSFKGSISRGVLTEQIVAGLFSEMGRQGMYSAANSLIPESYKSNQVRTWQTNTYLNHLEQTWVSFMNKERDERSLLSRLIADKSLKVFEFESLIPFLIDRGSSVLIKDLEALVEKIDVEQLSVLQAVGILEVSTDCSQYLKGKKNYFALLNEACERVVQGATVFVDDSLYLSEDGVTVDVLNSLKTARILQKYGRENPGKEAWEKVGKFLALSLLNYTDVNAAIPMSFKIVKDNSRSGSINLVKNSDTLYNAALLYPIIVDSTWYPHAKSFAKDGYSGMWAWTCAEDIKISKYEDSVLIRTKFPQGATHYMVVRGVKPFARIQIYGMDFRTDPRFETYDSSGYRYDAKTETLYLKMRHKVEFEEVLLFYE